MTVVIAFGALTPLQRLGAQRQPSTADVSALLERCTSIPDAQACRLTLRQLAATPAQRSVALTYLAEFDGKSDSLLVQAVRADPRNALAHYQLGERYMQIGSREAYRHFLTAQRLRPDWTHVRQRLAEAWRFRPQATAAPPLALWRSAASAEPRSVRVLAALGRAQMSMGQLAAAEATLRRANALERDVPEIQWTLCVILLETKRMAGAASTCRRVIVGWDGDHGGELHEIALAAEAFGAHDIALAAACRHLAEHGDSEYLRTHRTRILRLMNRNDCEGAP
jgi:Tfp pilus assembly protein PilF